MKTVRFDNPCEECILRGRKKGKAKGPKDARFLVVTKPPTEAMVRDGRHLSAQAMNVFAEYMGDLGFNRNDFVFASTVRCAYDRDLFDRAERKNIETHCREYMLRVIEQMEPEVIIPLGAEAAKTVFGRGVKITKVRGIPEFSEVFQSYMLPMTDPSTAHFRPEQKPIFRSDCNTLARLVDHEYDVDLAEAEVLGEYEIIDDLQFLVDMEPEILSFDTETLGTRYAASVGKILTMQFSTEPGKGYLLSWDHPDDPKGPRAKRRLRSQLMQLLQNPNTRVIGQNLKYDAVWVYFHLKFRFRIDGDTLMMAAILDENLLNKDLDTLTKIYAPGMAGYADSFNSKWDKSRMDLVPLTEIVPYGCGDVDAAIQVHAELESQLREDQKLWEHYRYVSIPGLNAFTRVEARGLLTHPGRLTDLESQLTISVRQQEKDIQRQIPRSIKRKAVADYTSGKDGHRKDPAKAISLTRQEYLRDILFYHKDGLRLKPMVFTDSTAKLAPEKRVASTSTKDHLPYFFEEHPLVQQISEYIKQNRLLGTNVQGFREKYIIDNKVYPQYSLSTAVTGRTSSRDPNGQNFPKRGGVAKAYRSIFVPPPGFIMLEADLSQAELRISADMANDPVMLSIYNAGGDIHAKTAAATMGMHMEEFLAGKHDHTPLIEVANHWPGAGLYLKGIRSRTERNEVTVAKYVNFKRFQAKAINFGFIYGMGWRKFIGYAKTQYGVEFTEEEAQQIREDFFRTYPALLNWHKSMRNFVNRHGYVRSYSGRIRHLPSIWSEDEAIASEASRQAINSPVQEFGSSLGVMAIARIDQEIDEQYLAPIGFVHDAIYALAPLEYADWAARTLKWYMETNPLEEWFGRRMKCPIVADVSLGMDGGHQFEMEGLKVDEWYDFSQIDDFDIELPEQIEPPNDGLIELPDYLRVAA